MIWKVGGWVLLFLGLSIGTAFANHQVDEIEAALSDAVGAAIESKQSKNLSEEDQAYADFLLAVYRHDSDARGKAEVLYERLNTPESKAFLGSIEMLKARDYQGGVFQLFKRKKLVQTGIGELDTAAEAHPENPKVRIVRAISYLGLPAFFGKFEEGLADIEKVLRWIKEEKVSVPAEETFFRDRASLYYYAGRYYLRKGEKKKAKEMFSKTSDIAFNSPFAVAARKRIVALR
jgi:tetratricopeptide (TPR) repeat protein